LGNIKKIYLKLYEEFIYLQLDTKLNNVFVTLLSNGGRVLFKYSTGFYGVSGRKKEICMFLKI